MLSKTLGNGKIMPCYAFGMGTAWYGATGEKAEEMKKAIKLALNNKYYHLDSAQMYKNEISSGIAIKEWLNESKLTREDLFITSKLADYNKDKVLESCKQTLNELQLDYLDLFLIHSPFKSNIPLSNIWKDMELLVEQGLVKSIGVSNFRVKELKEIISNCKIKPCVNQIEYHPFVQDSELEKYCSDNNIQIMAFAGLAPIIHFKGILDDLLNELSSKYNSQSSHILQKWLFMKNIGIVTTSSKEERLKDFYNIPNVKLTQEDADRISEIGFKHPNRKYWSEDWN